MTFNEIVMASNLLAMAPRLSWMIASCFPILFSRIRPASSPFLLTAPLLGAALLLSPTAQGGWWEFSH